MTDNEPKPGEQTPTTTPAEERGERLDTGRAIARGGKQSGPVPGATTPDDKDRRAGSSDSDRQ